MYSVDGFMGGFIIVCLIAALAVAYSQGVREGARQQRCGVYECSLESDVCGTPRECGAVPSAPAERGAQ